jgi:hypothetical protein
MESQGREARGRTWICYRLVNLEGCLDYSIIKGVMEG